MSLSQKHLKRHLHYDEATGVFTRLIANSNNSRVGEVAGSKTGHGYIEIKIDGVTYKAHRLAWLYVHGRLPTGDMDHANLDRSDNRISNLREATRTQNQCNREMLPSNKTGFKGVSFHKASGKYVAQGSYGGKKHYLGVFATPEKASEVYTAFATKTHGPFART